MKNNKDKKRMNTKFTIMQYAIRHYAILKDDTRIITSDEALIISCFDQTISKVLTIKTPVYN